MGRNGHFAGVDVSTSHSRLDVSTSSHDGATRLAVAGELDLDTAGRLETALKEAETDEPERLVLDLSNLRFLDSSGLKLILRAHARAKEGARRLQIVPGPTAVQQVFKVTGLSRRLEFLA